MNKSDEKRLWRRFAILNTEDKIEIIETSLFITKAKAEEIYTMLTQELSKRESLDAATRTWNEEKQKLVLEKLQAMRKTKRQKVMRYMDEIIVLRQKNIGWRKISEYLRKTHRFKISDVTLLKYFGGVL